MDQKKSLASKKVVAITHLAELKFLYSNIFHM